LALGVVLLGAIILVKANRHPRAIPILLPLLIINLLWFAMTSLLHFPSSARMQFGPIIVSYTAAIAVLWLCAHKLGNRNRFVTFLLASGVAAGLCLVGIVSYLGWGFSREAVASLIVLAVMVLVGLLAFALAGWCCRSHYGPVRFMLYLALWTALVGLATTVSVYATVFLLQQAPVSFFIVLLVAGSGGLVLGVCIYVINLSYMVFALRSPFFRERFYTCLRLGSMHTTLGSHVDLNPLNEQSMSTETSRNGLSV
jgi:hypothetical protein